MSECENVNLNKIDQLDGNDSICSNSENVSPALDISINSSHKSSDTSYIINSDISDIGQLDGNASFVSTKGTLKNNNRNHKIQPKPDRITSAQYMPVVATYNCRSIFPKLSNLKKIYFGEEYSSCFLLRNLGKKGKQAAPI